VAAGRRRGRPSVSAVKRRLIKADLFPKTKTPPVDSGGGHH